MVRGSFQKIKDPKIDLEIVGLLLMGHPQKGPQNLQKQLCLSEGHLSLSGRICSSRYRVGISQEFGNGDLRLPQGSKYKFDEDPGFKTRN